IFSVFILVGLIHLQNFAGKLTLYFELRHITPLKLICWIINHNCFQICSYCFGKANNICQRQHSHLMSILDIHERLWVRTQVGTEIYWIGLTDQITEGVWEWTDGSTFLPYLAQGQPDNWNDNEDCGQVVGESNGQWNDENCDAKRRYICKYIEGKQKTFIFKGYNYILL
uniref:C-type lectin domain-containing protein n=1 Tax=Periophthalmus magnuspinnatus TaxID=409849 RepID=A0A3B3Z743_9GOBI